MMVEAAISLMLECPICQEHFTDPRVLPCQHTFCLLCLEKIIEHQRAKDSIPCPVCRATYQILTAEIRILPKNIFAVNLIDIVGQDDINQGKAESAVSNTGQRQLCTLDTDVCTQPAPVYCDVCDVYMCEQCELSHKNSKFARNHKIRPATQATTRQKQPFCPEHTSKLLDIFCEDCNSILCYMCFFNEHKKHKSYKLEDKMKKLRGQLDHMLTLTSQSLKAIHKAIKMTHEQAVKIKADVTKLKQQTSAAYSAIQGHVDGRIEEEAERYLASIDEYSRQAEKVIAETLDKQETQEAVLHSIHLYGRHLSNGSAYDLNTNVSSLLKRAEEEVSKSVSEMRWKVDLAWSDWKVKGEVDRVRLLRDEVNVEPLARVKSGRHNERGGTQLNKFTTRYNELISGMLSYHNHLFIVHKEHTKLYVYDERGRLKKSVPIYCETNNHKMLNPWGICLVRGERNIHRLVISDYSENCLWWLTIEKKAGDVKLGHPQQHKLQYRPYRLSTDRSGRAVVADRINSRVYVYNHPGKHVICLQLSAGVHPWQVLSDQSDGYVVCYPGQLAWINSVGEVTRRYTEQPAVSPRYIMDDGTDLLVSDRDNNCLHIVTKEGSHYGKLITDIDPRCVCLDPAGRRLWVAYEAKDHVIERHVIELSYMPRSSSPVTSRVTSDPTIVSLTLKVTLPRALLETHI